MADIAADFKDFVTVVTNVDHPPKRMTKQVELAADGGSFKVIDYDRGATWYRFEMVPLDGANIMAGLWKVIGELGPEQFIVHGQVRHDDPAVDPNCSHRTHDPKKHEHPTLEDAAHLWHAQDFDKIPALDPAGEFDPITEPERAARHLRTLLPPEFHGAFCIWRLSSSAGFKVIDGKSSINMRLFFQLSEPRTAEQIKSWLGPYLKERDDKKVKVNGARGVLDGAIYTPSQPIYCAAPVLGEGVVDPVRQRMGHLEGHLVQVPALDAERDVIAADGSTRREKVFDTKGDVEAANGPPENRIVWDAPETIAWAVKAIDDDVKVNGVPKEGEHSDIRAYELVGKLRDGDRFGYSPRPETIAALLKAHWAPHFDLSWLHDKAESTGYQNGAGCGPLGSASRLAGASRIRAAMPTTEAPFVDPGPAADTPFVDPPDPEAEEDQRVIDLFMTIGGGNHALDETAITDECAEDFDESAIPERPQLADDRFGSGHSILFSAPAGTGKTDVMQQMFKAMVYGREMFAPRRPLPRIGPARNQFGVAVDGTGNPLAWCAPPVGVKVQHVEFLNYEVDKDEMRRRGRRIVKGMGLTPEAKARGTYERHDLRKTRSPIFLVWQDRDGEVKYSVTKFGLGLFKRWLAIAERLKATGGHMVIALDGLANAIKAVAGGGTGRLNDDIIQFTGYILDHWCELLNATIFAATHPSYASQARGGADIGRSQEYMNTWSQLVSMTSTGKDTAKLSIMKWRNGPKWEAEIGRQDGVWVAGAKGQMNDLSAVETAYLEQVYGVADLAALRAGNLTAEETAELEERHPARLRREAKGVRWGEGKDAVALRDTHPMVQRVAQLAGKPYSAAEFKKAMEMIEENGRIAYYARGAQSTRSEQRGGTPTGYCFPHSEMMEAYRNERRAELAKQWEANSATVAGHA